MALEKGKKYLNFLFLNVTPKGETPTWARVHYATEWTDTMNPNVVTYDYIADSAPTNEVENYAPSTNIPYTAYIGDPIYDYVFDLYQKQSTGTDTVTQALRVYQQKSDGANVATLTDATIVIQDFNDAEQTLSFDITQRGTPIQGTAVVDTSGKPVFTPEVTP